MTINMTTVIPQPNVTRWRVLAFDLVSGVVTLRFGSPGEAQVVDVVCRLSDTANGSTGVAPNPTPQSWNDKVVSVGPTPFNGFVGVGAANSLANAQTAYRSANNHAAGLKNVETQALVDGWVAPALTGT